MAPSSSSSSSSSLKALVVFRNRIHTELIRTVHVYQLEGGAEEVTEREYVFRENIDYEEMKYPGRVFTLRRFDVSAQYQGLENGVWDCIYVFNSTLPDHPNLDHLPEDLSVVSNPKLATIPSLANDLEVIFHLGNTSEYVDSSEVLAEEESGNLHSEEGHRPRGNPQVPLLDLNSLPCGEAETEDINPSVAGRGQKKLKRAATKDIARIALEDLARHFDVPIIEASKNLKVGLTVLKKKCREFGIPRWPHRKIKSLEGLIRDLQGEVKRQQEEDEVAAMAVAKRQRMIESEKESIEKKPFLDIQWETKKFRQDIFKRRHRARAHENQSRTLSLF
ncbi:OLC1v1010540C2 [Oldenlandia corymbosa var. corymbosa]|nr:OLC1v1010540C2 [Oldenlandia corymbosa var. corymbosa]